MPIGHGVPFPMLVEHCRVVKMHDVSHFSPYAVLPPSSVNKCKQRPSVTNSLGYLLLVWRRAGFRLPVIGRGFFRATKANRIVSVVLLLRGMCFGRFWPPGMLRPEEERLAMLLAR